jgi:hypothetical protein
MPCQQGVVKVDPTKWIRREAAIAVKIGKRVQRACGHGCESERDATAYTEDCFRRTFLRRNGRLSYGKRPFPSLPMVCSLKALLA